LRVDLSVRKVLIYRLGSLGDAVVACQQAGEAPRGDPAGLVLVAWSAVHGFATLWVDRALPFQGLEPERLAPEIGRLITRMFSALVLCVIAASARRAPIIRSRPRSSSFASRRCARCGSRLKRCPKPRVQRQKCLPT